MFLYVLKLKQNKYYIGKTSNPKFRLGQHFNCSGSAWTTKYQPVKVIELVPNCDNFDEDKYTLKYMSVYGIENVRGGSFCEITLSKANLTMVNKMISSSTDKCFKCGKSDHFINDCKELTAKTVTKATKATTTKYNNNSDDLQTDTIFCYKCHRNGHLANKCYAKTTNTGKRIKNNSDDEEYDSSDDMDMNMDMDEEYNDSANSDDDEECDDCDNSDDEYVEVYCCGYCNKEFETMKGATYHENFYCKNNKKYRKN